MVDIEAAKERNIPVSNIPTYGTAAVGHLAIALLLEICHHIGYHSEAVREGKMGPESGLVLLGLSSDRTGSKDNGNYRLWQNRAVYGRIAQALGMRVLAYDSYQNPELVSDTCRYAALDELLECSDVIALHCPLFPETEKIINKDTIAKMKDGVIILNNSRGPLIEEQDLADALKSGKVSGSRTGCGVL